MSSDIESRLSEALERIADSVAHATPPLRRIDGDHQVAGRAAHVRWPRPRGRGWSASRWVGIAAAVVVLVGVAAVAVARLRPGSSPTAPTTATAAPPPSLPVTTAAATPPPTAGATTPPSTPAAAITELFAPSAIPAGFTLDEASTAQGPPAHAQPQVSLETWISRDSTGAIDGVVRLGASRQIVVPPTGPTAGGGELSVHGQPASAFPVPSGGSAVSWSENGLTLVVMSWADDAAAVAEQSIVSPAEGITLPVGALVESYVRADTHLDPALIDATTSELSFLSDDGTVALSFSASPNTGGDTADTTAWTPGSQPHQVGNRRVWVTASDSGLRSALWVQGSSILTVNGRVSEETLLAFVASIQSATPEQFAALIHARSDQLATLPDRDSGVFPDGLEVSLHTDLDDLASQRVDASHSVVLCATGDETHCATASPSTTGGLLTTATATATINGTRELVIWQSNTATVERVYDTSTGVDLPFQTVSGTLGTVTRVQAGPGIDSVGVDYLAADGTTGGGITGSLDPVDLLADVTTAEHGA